MITNFNQYITESLTDKMVGKPFEDVFVYDNFEPILRNFDLKELGEHKDLEILIDQFPILIDSKLEDLRYFLIREDAYTQDNNGKIVQTKSYIDALDLYTENSPPEIVEIPGLTSGVIETILVNKDKKIIIVHSTISTMVVLDKNIFNK